MSDREKVINYAEETLSNVLPDEKDTSGIMVKVGWIREVLALLKKQEAVEPINSYGTFRCGNCRNIVGYNDGHGRGYQNNFCSKCGQAVKWE